MKSYRLCDKSHREAFACCLNAPQLVWMDSSASSRQRSVTIPYLIFRFSVIRKQVARQIRSTSDSECLSAEKERNL
jgi:hypothetical protein